VTGRIRAGITLLTTGALILLFISSRAWVSAKFAETNSPTLVLPISGRALDPLGAGCSWALIASTLAYLVSKGPIRKAVAVVITLLGTGALLSAWSSRGGAISGQVDALVSEAVGRTVTGAVYASNLLWLLAVVCSGLCVVSGLLLLTSPSGPTKPSRYERAESSHDLTPWQALDAGLDPTQD
jgi:hypothetical protein